MMIRASIFFCFLLIYSSLLYLACTVPMAVATVGAIALAVSGAGDYTEAVAVMLFYQIGEWFQSYAVGEGQVPSTQWILQTPS